MYRTLNIFRFTLSFFFWFDRNLHIGRSIFVSCWNQFSCADRSRLCTIQSWPIAVEYEITENYVYRLNIKLFSMYIEPGVLRTNINDTRWSVRQATDHVQGRLIDEDDGWGPKVQKKKPKYLGKAKDQLLCFILDMHYVYPAGWSRTIYPKMCVCVLFLMQCIDMSYLISVFCFSLFVFFPGGFFPTIKLFCCFLLAYINAGLLLTST